MTSEEPRTPTNQDRQVKVILVAVAIAAVVALLWPKPESSAIPGEPLLDATGRPAPLSTRLEPVTLLYFWATWCQTCMSELPALGRLVEDFRGEEGFRLVKVAVGDEHAQVERVLAGGANQMLYDPEWRVARRFGTEAVPESYLVVQGKVTHKFVGPTNWDDAAVRGRLRRALEAHRRS